MVWQLSNYSMYQSVQKNNYDDNTAAMVGTLSCKSFDIGAMFVHICMDLEFEGKSEASEV